MPVMMGYLVHGNHVRERDVNLIMQSESYGSEDELREVPWQLDSSLQVVEIAS